MRLLPVPVEPGVVPASAAAADCPVFAQDLGDPLRRGQVAEVRGLADPLGPGLGDQLLDGRQ